MKPLRLFKPLKESPKNIFDNVAFVAIDSDNPVQLIYTLKK
jgi:hypothetical protein